MSSVRKNSNIVTRNQLRSKPLAILNSIDPSRNTRKREWGERGGAKGGKGEEGGEFKKRQRNGVLKRESERERESEWRRGGGGGGGGGEINRLPALSIYSRFRFLTHLIHFLFNFGLCFQFSFFFLRLLSDFLLLFLSSSSTSLSLGNPNGNGFPKIFTKFSGFFFCNELFSNWFDHEWLFSRTFVSGIGWMTLFIAHRHQIQESQWV